MRLMLIGTFVFHSYVIFLLYVLTSSFIKYYLKLKNVQYRLYNFIKVFKNTEAWSTVCIMEIIFW